MTRVIDEIKSLNNQIVEELGTGFQIGHSYFVGSAYKVDSVNRVEEVVEYEIIPQLFEYWFDDEQKAKNWAERLRGCSRPQIQWNVDDGFIEALPIMQTDIVLQRGNKTLIVDTKFYSENMVARFEGGASKQKSGNLYQIFTYLNNWNKKSDEIVGGMLLYARTTAFNQPTHTYNINGNKIFILSLDLNQDFNGIKVDLSTYAINFFN